MDAEESHPNFAQSTFTILDQDSIERRVCWIGYIDETDPDDRMLCSDFHSDLYVRVAIEMRTIDWDEQMMAATAKT